MNLFRTAYDLQQRLLDAEPKHEVVKNKYMAVEGDSYQLRADGEFLIRYTENGTENQVRAYIRDLETALAKLPSAKKSNQPVGQ